RLLGLAELTGLGIDRLLLLLDRLRHQLLLQLRREDQLEDPKVGRLPVEVDAGVLGRPGSLLVGREEGVLQRSHERLGVDPLLLLEALDRLDDLAAHLATSRWLRCSGTRLERRIPERGISTSRTPASTRTPRSSAAVSVPVKLRWPSIDSRVRTRTRRPMNWRKCSGLVSGRSAPGEETSSDQASSRSRSWLVTRSQRARSTPSG